jgi:hypothetical protein
MRYVYEAVPRDPATGILDFSRAVELTEAEYRQGRPAWLPPEAWAAQRWVTLCREAEDGRASLRR